MAFIGLVGLLAVALAVAMQRQVNWPPFVGGYLAKGLTTKAADGVTEVTDWATFWWVPSVGVFAALAVFVLFFRMHPRRPAETPVAVHA